MEIVRVWMEPRGWEHEVRDANGLVARSRHRDLLEDAFPEARPSGRVECVGHVYAESDGRSL